MPKKRILPLRGWNWQELHLGISMNAVLQFVVVPDSEAIVGQEGREGETTTAGIFPSAHCSLPLCASQLNCKAL